MNNDTVYCRACGTQLHITATTCSHCGAPQRLGGEKNRIAAALLAFFLGSFGVHKFYLGKIGQGFLYLIFCWTFIPAIVSFIEFIIYLCQSDQKFAEKYG
ncbi:TM2 domain-containing protein [Serratia odorifera]|uniref:TM2 domain-containing protein n=1 Tax=Serratia odorifera TaxID=618 RepID=UPI0018E7E14F|nr:TM2 domain-containing protein [Serratia odorifera]MBJ2065043.1 TM2 domain-containing protein [Serratia odorifera]